MTDTVFGYNKGQDGHLVTEASKTNISGLIDTIVTNASTLDTAIGVISAAGTAATATEIAAVRTAFSTLSANITLANTNDPITKDMNVVVNGSKSIRKKDLGEFLERVEEHLIEQNTTIPGT